MPFIFSEKQINEAHQLLTEHAFDVNQLSDHMGCNIRSAWFLIRLVKQKYPLYKNGEPAKPVYIRPKAEYSNPNYQY